MQHITIDKSLADYVKQQCDKVNKEYSLVSHITKELSPEELAAITDELSLALHKKRMRRAQKLLSMPPIPKRNLKLFKIYRTFNKVGYHTHYQGDTTEAKERIAMIERIEKAIGRAI